MFRGRRESAGSVYIRYSTQLSPANSAESERSLSASLHSVTGECNWRKSNPYWLRWPSPDCIWRTDGTCSLLSGGTEIAVWVAKNREHQLRAKACESGNMAQSTRQHTNGTDRQPKHKQTKRHTHRKQQQKQHQTNKTQKQRQTNRQQTNSRNAIPETQLGSRWDCMPDCNSPRGVGTVGSNRLEKENWSKR